MHPVLDLLKVQHSENFGWALACCAWQRDSAEDVLQEAYLRVLDGRAKFAGKSSEQTWFFSVIKRVASDVSRTQKRRRILNLRVVVSALAPSPEYEAVRSNPLSDAVDADESSRQLQAALMQLSTRQREVLHLVFYAGLTLEEAAETLGVSVGSTRTYYHRGKVRLAELLRLEESYE